MIFVLHLLLFLFFKIFLAFFCLSETISLSSKSRDKIYPLRVGIRFAYVLFLSDLLFVRLRWICYYCWQWGRQKKKRLLLWSCRYIFYFMLLAIIDPQNYYSVLLSNIIKIKSENVSVQIKKHLIIWTGKIITNTTTCSLMTC